MATLMTNPDGTILLDLTPAEQDTLAALPPGQLDSYITLWLRERGKQVLFDRFNTLTDQDRAVVLTTLQKSDQAMAAGGLTLG